MMKKELFSKLLLTLFMVLAGVSFTACGDDEDEPQTQVYNYGFEDLHASGSDFSYLTELATVENAFKTVLGSSPFTLSGSSQDCDAKIVEACKKVEASLKDRTWGFTARFEVTNQTTGKVVYSLQFTQGSNLN